MERETRHPTESRKPSRAPWRWWALRRYYPLTEETGMKPDREQCGGDKP